MKTRMSKNENTPGKAQTCLAADREREVLKIQSIFLVSFVPLWDTMSKIHKHKRS
jgi:hypothetical protein